MTPRSDPVRPEDVLRLSADEADALLDRLERTVPVRPPLVELPPSPATELIAFGDTHGDWRSTLEVVRAFEAEGRPRLLVGLGDYVDRAPEDCGEGSVANSLFLLDLTSRHPDRVFLVQGNHETVRRIPALPHDLPEEVDQLWGPQVDRYARLLGLLERGPLALTSPNGVYCAHAGFPFRLDAPRWQTSFDRSGEEELAELVWAGCDASESPRGFVPRFGALELEQFLHATGLTMFVRGHDPALTGRPVYRGRCLTLQTTRVYQRFGGVVMARVPLDRPVRSVAELAVEHLATEGRTFPTP